MIALQPGDIVVIILVAVLFFAPTRVPQLIRGFKQMFSAFRNEINSTETKADPTTSLKKKS